MPRVEYAVASAEQVVLAATAATGGFGSDSSNSSGNSSNKRILEDSGEGPECKITRKEGETQGEITKTMGIDKVDDDNWEEEKQNLREVKVPFVIIKGINKKRAVEVS